jgi:hypothetical protein
MSAFLHLGKAAERLVDSQYNNIILVMILQLFPSSKEDTFQIRLKNIVLSTAFLLLMSRAFHFAHTCCTPKLKQKEDPKPQIVFR